MKNVYNKKSVTHNIAKQKNKCKKGLIMGNNKQISQLIVATDE